MSEASANALRVALALGLIGRTGATVLHALVALAKGKLFIAGADQASVEEYVAREREAAAAQLACFIRRSLGCDSKDGDEAVGFA
jgi:hypothetical protein